MRIRLWLIAVTLLLCSPIYGQSVGLVLSGGGAKGLYHIGVIKAMEDNGIPIDYVTGTSIGAIVGGLYSAGYSPDEMIDIFSSGELRYWITGEIENRYKFYFKQMRQNAAMFTLHLDFRSPGKIAKLPPSFVASDQLDMAFIEFFSSATAASGGDFDRLFVPFRCVATDAANRKEVVFSEGDMGTAIRASMSIPMVFPPIVRDSMVLFDGGLFDNFPWKIMENDFSPDIIIGSKSGVGMDHEETDDSLLDYVFMLTTLHTDYNLPDEKDITIERAFPSVSSMDFDKARYLIEQGYEDAMSQMEVIKSRISRLAEPVDVAAKRSAYRDSLPDLLFDNIYVSGLNSRQTAYIRGLMGFSKGKESYTFDELKYQYFKILAEGDIDGDFPEISFDDQTDYFSISMKMNTKPSLKLMVGGNISSTALNQAYVGLEYKTIGHTANIYSFDGYLSAFHNSMTLLGRNDFFIRMPFYIEYGGSFNFYNFFRSNYGFLSKGNDLTYSKYRDHYGTFSIGTPISRHSVLNLRSNYGQDEYLYFQKTGYEEDDKMDRTRFRFYSIKLEFERKGYNYISYPTRGIHQIISGIMVSGREKFLPGISGTDLHQMPSSKHHTWFGLRFMREHYVAMHGVKWFSWGYLIDGVWTNHSTFTNDYSTNISSPAFTPTQHSKIVYMKEFRSDSYIAGGLIPIFEISPQFYLKCSSFIFLPNRYNQQRDQVRQRLRYIFDATLVYQTFLGPVSLSLSQYDAVKSNWFLTFNFGFAIFNPKGIYY